jgi:hypothetical protein
MGRMKTGIVSYTNNTNNSSGGNSSELKSQLKNLNGKIVAARVTDIVLDENHDKFSNVGQWSGIGAIYFEFVNQSGTGTNVNYALPYDSQLKTYPLVNEIVLLISLPNKNMGKQTSSESYFYLKPLGIWNHPHHDAYPNILDEVAKKRLKNNNPTIPIPSVNDGIDNTIELNSPTNISQNTFVERENIKPLIPFMGDSLMEGRYGQSIRFGSTAKSLSQYRNNWSESGDNGDPILIIRNGQPEKLKDDRGWIPITEDLNKDLSSIYLTSKQKIPFSIANENFLSSSYSNGTSPTTPSLYINPQIILNSDRIVLNAKKDSVLISGQKSVGLSSNDSVNIGAKQIYIDGSDIRLGSKDAEEPVLLGNQTTQLLEILIKELINISEKLKSPALFKIDPTLPPVASIASTNLNKILNKLDSIKSNFVKTS